jgi:hypothetical protein
MCGDFRAGDATHLRQQTDVGFDRKPRQHIVGLKYDADVARRFNLFASQKFNATGRVGFDQAGNDAE